MYPHLDQDFDWGLKVQTRVGRVLQTFPWNPSGYHSGYQIWVPRLQKSNRYLLLIHNRGCQKNQMPGYSTWPQFSDFLGKITALNPPVLSRFFREAWLVLWGRWNSWNRWFFGSDFSNSQNQRLLPGIKETPTRPPRHWFEPGVKLTGNLTCVVILTSRHSR